MTDSPIHVPMYDPLIEREEIGNAVEALEMKWLGMGEYVARFERSVAEFLETDRHVVAVSTGHAALHLALRIAGVGEGDEVITPAFNNVADFQAILAVGARPVFCDVDERTLCIDLHSAAALVGERTKAILPMDYGVWNCDYDAVERLAEWHGLRVIHDAAHSFGSRSRGRRVGSFSDLCMFSFDPVKNMTCIDGGAVIVRDEADVERLHRMRLIGMGQPASVMYQNQRAWTYDVSELGYRYHMPNLHAAIGLAQLAKMPEITERRRSACRYYNERLGEVSDVVVPATDFADVCPFLYYVRVPAETRDAFRVGLRERGIETGIHWQPGHRFSLFEDARRGPLPVTERIEHEIVSLPLHSNMTDKALERVADAVADFFVEERVG